jgi:hypothetical protein
VIRAIKARRERLSRRFGREIDGHEDRIVVMVVSVPYGLVAIGIKPLTYLGHHCGKLSTAYPDPDAVHSPLCMHLSIQPGVLLQILGQELLTNISATASAAFIVGAGSH